MVQSKIMVLLAIALCVSAFCLVLPAGAAQETPSSTAMGDGQGATRAAKRPVTITSERMEASRDNNLITFSGNVEVKEDFTLCADTLHVYYGEKKDVNEIIATGSVTIYYQDRVAVAGKAIYDRGARTLVLTESPEIRQCSDVVRGDKITFDIDRSDALVESQKGARVFAVLMAGKECAEGKKDRGEEVSCKGAR